MDIKASSSIGGSDQPETRLAVPILTACLRDMLLIRRFEEKVSQLYKQGLIGGFCHLYNGQEAVVVGAERARREGDQMITGYRDHGHMIACGANPRNIMAELLGRRDGTSKGKGGSMHLFAPHKDFYGGHGIVGAEVPIGTGIAFANHYRANDYVCMTFFGDGAANQGQVYESFNMAALWKLPIVYIVENNQYAMGTHIDRASAQTDLAGRGEGFGISGITVDGMDLEAVYVAIARALSWARSGEGPQLIVMETYRYSGHSMSDPARYRKREEVKEVRAHHDPITILQERLLERKALSDAAFDQMEKEIAAIVEDAAAFAQQNPLPDHAELMIDIYREHPHAG